MHLDDIVSKLQLSIGPVILISGVGLLLLTMTNRLARVIDRARLFSDAIVDARAQDYESTVFQLTVLSRRARLLRMSIALAAISVLLAAVLVIALFLFALLKLDEPYVVVLLFIACLSTLIVSLFYFLRDINLSLLALEREIKDSEAACRARSGRNQAQ